MSNWDSNDLGYEDYDPNKDYSVQVKRNDGGLASTQVRIKIWKKSKNLEKNRKIWKRIEKFEKKSKNFIFSERYKKLKSQNK
mgnify:CR=1 FL=1